MGPAIEEGVSSPWDDDDRMFRAITTKLEHSRQTCEEILKLYEIRAEIEEDYGERLLKLSQLLVGQNEEGTLAASISHVPSAMETTGRAHSDLSQQLRRNLEAPLKNFLKDQEEKRRAQHQQVENSAQLRLKHSANVVKLRGYYTAECTKLSRMQKYLKEKMPMMSPKEVHQVEEEIIEQEEVVAAAEQEFRRAEEVLNDVTEKWLSDWENACNVFQKLEKERIQYLQQSLSGFANTMSNMYIVDEQCCGRLRSALDKTDVERDVNLFTYKYGFKSRSRDGSISQDIYRGEQTPPPTVGLPPLPTALPPLPPIIPPATSPTDTTEKPSLPRAFSDTAITQESDTHQPGPRSISLVSLKQDGSQRELTNVDGLEAEGAQDTMSFAFQEVESMLDGVGSRFDSLSLGYKKVPGSQSTESNDRVITDSTFTERSKSPSSSSTSSRRKTDSNLRFKPIPNPEYDIRKSASPIPYQLDNNNAAIDNKETNRNNRQDEDTESEDEFPPLAKRKPREEKWMISSVRRPQQLPVLSQNAKIYRRS